MFKVVMAPKVLHLEKPVFKAQTLCREFQDVELDFQVLCPCAYSTLHRILNCGSQ